MASNGHNGHNGHKVLAFSQALDELGDEIARDQADRAACAAAPPGIVRCDTCNQLTSWADGGTHYRVHYASNVIRDPKTGQVTPPCPRSWPPKMRHAEASK